MSRNSRRSAWVADLVVLILIGVMAVVAVGGIIGTVAEAFRKALPL